MEEIATEVQKVKACVGDADRSLSHKVSDLDGSLSDAVQSLKSLRDKLDMAEAKRILEEMRSVKIGRIQSNMTDDSADASKRVDGRVADTEGQDNVANRAVPAPVAQAPQPAPLKVETVVPQQPPQV